MDSLPPGRPCSQWAELWSCVCGERGTGERRQEVVSGAERQQSEARQRQSGSSLNYCNSCDTSVNLKLYPVKN